MNKKGLLSLVIEKRLLLEELMDYLKNTNKLEDKIPGSQWLVKDVFSHVAWFEQEMVYMLHNRDMTRNEDIWRNPPEQRNEIVYEIIKSKTTSETVEYFHKQGLNIIKEIAAMNEEELVQGGVFKGMPKDWTPMLVLKGNTYLHYEEHYNSLKTALKL